jgi:GGDEF domain-containing protein
MAKAFRDTDIVGILDKRRIIVILPMTKETESKIAMRRILRQIHAEPVQINAIPLAVQFAGVVTVFDKDRTPTLKDYIRRVESDIFEMVERLRNVQTIY